MQNAGLDEAKARIKKAWRNINNLKYPDNITLMAKSIEELKSFLMKVKKKSWLETQHSETMIMACGSFTSWQIDGEVMETVTDFIFLGSKITEDGD